MYPRLHWTRQKFLRHDGQSVSERGFGGLGLKLFLAVRHHELSWLVSLRRLHVHHWLDRLEIHLVLRLRFLCSRNERGLILLNSLSSETLTRDQVRMLLLIVLFDAFHSLVCQHLPDWGRRRELLILRSHNEFIFVHFFLFFSQAELLTSFRDEWFIPPIVYWRVDLDFTSKNDALKISGRDPSAWIICLSCVALDQLLGIKRLKREPVWVFNLAIDSLKLCLGCDRWNAD